MTTKPNETIHGIFDFADPYHPTNSWRKFKAKQRLLELIRAWKPDEEQFVLGEGDGVQQNNDFANGYNHALIDFMAAIEEGFKGE